MGQPNPPGDLPLIEGLDASWNEFVSALPEDKRAELGPKLKERVSGYESLKQWESFNSRGVTPDAATAALNALDFIEKNPRETYDTLAKHLGITPAQAQQVVEELEEDDTDPRDAKIAQLEAAMNTLGQIELTKRQQEAQAKLDAQAEAELDKELKAVMTKLGTVPEDEIVMRMVHKGMTAEQAHNEYTGRLNEARKRPPAPFIMGASGQVPARGINPTKLTPEETKSVVAQMFAQGNAAG
jgi:DNA-binding Lrp family transcriptional regulator